MNREECTIIIFFISTGLKSDYNRCFLGNHVMLMGIRVSSPSFLPTLWSGCTRLSMGEKYKYRYIKGSENLALSLPSLKPLVERPVLLQGPRHRQPRAVAGAHLVEPEG